MENKKILVILAVGIILIVAIVIGGLIWLNSKKDITLNKAKSTINQDRITKQIVCTQEVKLCPDGSYVSRTGPNCEFTECPVTAKKNSDVDVENWKIYKNEKYGYEIKYSEDKAKIVLDKVFERGSEGNPGFEIKTGGHFAIGVWENMKNLNAKQWLDEQYNEYSGGWIWNFKEINIGGEKSFNGIRADSCYTEWIIIPKSNRFYTFGTEICEENKDDSIKTFRSIVDSFKFIK